MQCVAASFAPKCACQLAKMLRILHLMKPGAACVAASLIFLRLWAGPMPIHMIIATILGVWLTFMLGTGLMALVFLSSGTGHDEQVIDRIKDEVPEHDQDAR